MTWKGATMKWYVSIGLIYVAGAVYFFLDGYPWPDPCVYMLTAAVWFLAAYIRSQR